MLLLATVILLLLACVTNAATLHALGVLNIDGKTATVQALAMDSNTGVTAATSKVFKFTAPAAALICEADFALRPNGWQIATPANQFQPLNSLYFNWTTGDQVDMLTTNTYGLKLFSWTPDQNTNGFIGTFTNATDIGSPTWFLATVSATGDFNTLAQWPDWLTSHQPCLSVYDPVAHVYWFSQYDTDITAVSASDGFLLGTWDFEGTNIQSMEWAQGDNTSGVYLMLNDYAEVTTGGGNRHGNARLVRAYLADSPVEVKYDDIIDMAPNDYAYGYASSSFDPVAQLFYTIIATDLLNVTNPRMVTIDIKSRRIVRTAAIDVNLFNTFTGGIQSVTLF